MRRSHLVGLPASDDHLKTEDLGDLFFSQTMNATCFLRSIEPNPGIRIFPKSSNILGNIIKCLKAGYKRLIIVPTDAAAELKIKQKLRSFHIPKPLRVELKSWKEF